MVVGAYDLPKPFHKNPEPYKGRSASRANAASYQQNSDPPVRLSSWAGGPNKGRPVPFSFVVCVSVCVVPVC